MSKKIQKGANQDQMDTYMDTSPSVFPFLLRNKKLEIPEQFKNENERKYYLELEGYLLTENPENLLRAIKLHKNVLETDRNLYIDFNTERIINNDKYLEKINSVPHYVVVWATIHIWMFHDNDDQIRSLLKRVFTSKRFKFHNYELRHKDQIDYHFANDGLVHIVPHIKDNKPYITYVNPQNFLSNFNSIKNTFDSVRTKKRNLTRKEKIKFAEDAINILGEDLTSDEVRNLIYVNDDANIHIMSIRFISVMHPKKCQFCQNNKKKGLSYTTIEKLITKAKKKYIDPFIEMQNFIATLKAN